MRPNLFFGRHLNIIPGTNTVMSSDADAVTDADSLSAVHAEAGIELYTGPMFSGKTRALISVIQTESFFGRHCLLVKYVRDNRYTAEDIVQSHSDARQGALPPKDERAGIRVVAAATLAEVEPRPDELVVGIDEGQFYPDLVARCEQWAAGGRRVVVAALDGDFLRRPFGQVCELLPRCERVEKLRGVCTLCRRQYSAFSLRLAGAADGPVEVIGGADKYAPACRGCWLRGQPPA